MRLNSIFSRLRGLFFTDEVVEEVIMPDSEEHLIGIVLSEDHGWVRSGDFPHLYCSYYGWIISFWRYSNVLYLKASNGGTDVETRVPTDAPTWAPLLELHSSAMGKAKKISYV